MSISIILPVFNEVKSLEYVLSVWDKYLNEKKIIHEFVICEDGSTDGTKELINNLYKKYPITKNVKKKRRSYGLAIISGVIASKFNYILCIDSDGQCMPDSFQKFYDQKNLSDILIGNRNPRKDPVIRIIYSKLFKIIHDYLFNTKVKDPSCPYILAKKKIYLKLLNRLGFLKEGFWWGFVAAAKMLNLKICQIDIVHYNRYDGSTVVYKPTKMPMIIIRNIFGLIKLKKSFSI